MGYFKQFAVLKETGREFWAVQAINLFDSLYAFSFVMVSTLFLTNNMGMSDVKAGSALTWLGLMTSIFLFAAGPIVDRWGIKKSLYLGLGIVALVRIGMSACGFFTAIPHRDWIFLGLMGLGGLPSAIKGTAYQIGVKRYTSERSQSAGFNLVYIVTNIGAAGAGLVVHTIEKAQPAREHKEYAWVIVFGLLMGLCSFLSAWLFIKSDEQVGAEPKKDTPLSEGEVAERVEGEFGNLWTRAVAYTKMVVREPAFARMMAAMTLVLGVRMVFLYWQILSPKYWKRAIGPEAALGPLEAINPILIIVGLFLLVPVINRFKTFNMLTYGCFTAALSLVILAIPWYWWSPDPTRAYYTMSIVSMIVFSVGEIMFSPRLTQYILAIAPQGQEGIYSSFATMPFFIAKTAVGFLSGVMLMRWCPETRVVEGATKPLREVLGTRELPYWETPEAMWLILAIAAVIGPIIMLSLKGWFVRGMHNDPTVSRGAAH